MKQRSEISLLSFCWSNIYPIFCWSNIIYPISILLNFYFSHTGLWKFEDSSWRPEKIEPWTRGDTSWNGSSAKPVRIMNNAESRLDPVSKLQKHYIVDHIWMRCPVLWSTRTYCLLLNNYKEWPSRPLDLNKRNFQHRWGYLTVVRTHIWKPIPTNRDVCYSIQTLSRLQQRNDVG